MAQAYPYTFHGKQLLKQDKCTASLPLDKPRLWLDFNELAAEDEDGAPVYLFSRGDVVNDSAGGDVELYDGMAVSLFDDDCDPSGAPSALLAEGVLLENHLPQYPMVKWLVRMTKRPEGTARAGEYTCWMSDLETV